MINSIRTEQIIREQPQISMFSSLILSGNIDFKMLLIPRSGIRCNAKEQCRTLKELIPPVRKKITLQFFLKIWFGNEM